MKVSGSIAAALQDQVADATVLERLLGVKSIMYMRVCRPGQGCLYVMRSGRFYVMDGSFHAEVHEGELLKELPRQLRTDIVSHVLRDIFDSSHLFAVSSLHTPSDL